MKAIAMSMLLPPSLGFAPTFTKRPPTKLFVLFPNKKGIIVEDQAFIARDPLIDEYMNRPSTAPSFNMDNNHAGKDTQKGFHPAAYNANTQDEVEVRVTVINPGPIDRSKREILFPEKKGIIVEDQAFVARDPLIDDFMGRRSSIGDVLRNDNTPAASSTTGSNNARDGDGSSAGALLEPMIAGPIHPNHMNVREMQEELRERNVYFGDCFDRDSLMQRLWEARGEDVGRVGSAGGYGDGRVGWFDEGLGYKRHEHEMRGNANDLNDYGAARSNRQRNAGSERWVYGTPVPPDLPPPGYHNN